MKSVKAIIANAISAGQTSLSEYDSKMILSEYGIPTTQEFLVDELAAARNSLSWGLVMRSN
jgi:acyl-CoA synthetase (NDP forming)